MIQPGGRSARKVLGTIAIVGVLSVASGAARAQVCVGDCDSNNMVAINELIVGVNIALGTQNISVCKAFDCAGSGMVPINCLVQGVNNALTGCTGGSATPTPTTGGPSPTATAQPTAPLTKVRLTNLQLKYDLTKPAFLNNPVPIKFGITSNSADPSHPGGGSVVVSFSFVEAQPADPAKPRSCTSQGSVLQLMGNGVEQQFQADIIPTTDCATWVGADGAVANLSVDFDAFLRESGTPTGIDYPPVVFSTANSGAADNQLCRKTLDPNAADPGRGCVYPLQLKPAPTGADGKPLVSVKLDSLTPESSVAVLWPTAEDPDVPMGMRESDPPTVVVNAAFVLDGRDPYQRKVDADETIPPNLMDVADGFKYGLTDAELDALDDLPATASIKYDLVPTHLVAPDAPWMPLAIDDPKNPDPDGHLLAIDLSELEPGTDTGLSHALFIDTSTVPDTRAAVSAGGVWANETDFTVRGCIVASFEQGGDTGDEPDPEDVPAGGDVANGDCKTFKVVLMRPPAPTSSGALSQRSAADIAVTQHTFSESFVRAVGNPDKAQLSGSLSTMNTLDLNGAKTASEGVIEIKGFFNIKLFRAFANASALTTLATSSYDVGVDAFGVNIVGMQMMGSELTFSQPLTFMKMTDFPPFRFVAVFIPISIGFGAGGNVGVTPSVTISAKTGAPSPPVAGLENATSNGKLEFEVKPEAGLSGTVSASVGFACFPGKAGIQATVQIIQIGFPVKGTLAWGVTAQDMAMMVTQITVIGQLTWDLTLNWLNTQVDALGCLLGFSKSVNIFKYENPPQTINLLTRSLPSAIVLGSGGMPPPTDTPMPMAGTPTDTPMPMEGTPTDTPMPMAGTPTDTPISMEATPTDTPISMEATPTDTPMPMGASPTPTDTPISTDATPTDTPDAH